MALSDTGTDVKDRKEPVPRDFLRFFPDGVQRTVLNWFGGQDRMLGEIVSGVNRNRQNIIQLETDYTAADGALSTAYIAADAVVAADAASARAALSVSLQSSWESDDTAILASANSYTDTEVSAEGSARATAIDTVQATVYDTAQRPNLVPPEYQIVNQATGAPFTVVAGVQGATGTLNPANGKAVVKFTSDGTQAFMLTRFTPSSSTINMTLPPARYGIKLLAAYGSTGSITQHRAFLRNAAGTIIATADLGTSFTGGFDLFDGVLDLSAATGVSEYYLDIALNFSGAVAGVTFLPARVQVELLPDDATGPGDWSTNTAVNAKVIQFSEAYATNTSSTARLVWTVNTSTNAAIFEQTAAEGYTDGTWNGSAISLTADEITLDGDVVITGTLTTDKLAANAVTNSVGAAASGVTTLTAHTWTSVASVAITTTGNPVFIAYNSVNYITTAGMTYPIVMARIDRTSTVIRAEHTAALPIYDGAGGMVCGGAYSGSLIDTPAAGTYTYRLYIKLTNAAGSGTLDTRTVESRSIYCTEFKR